MTVELELPKDWQAFKLPPARYDRWQERLNRQDELGCLDARHRREAEAFTQLVDMVALMKLRAEATQK